MLERADPRRHGRAHASEFAVAWLPPQPSPASGRGRRSRGAAQSYADTAAKIAKGTFHAGRYIDALTLRGDAELALNQPAEARASWELAAETSEKAQCPAAGQPALERLARLFRQARMRPEERSVETRISLIPKAPS